jgi:hypothetical protein
MAIDIEPTIIPMIETIISLFFSGIWCLAKNPRISKTISRNNSDATHDRIDLLLILTSFEVTLAIRHQSSKTDTAADPTRRVSEERTWSDNVNAPRDMEDHRVDDLKHSRLRLKEPDDPTADDPTHRHTLERWELGRLLLYICEVPAWKDLRDELAIFIEDKERIWSEVN